MFCRNCGRELKTGQVFCPGCGAKTMMQKAESALGNQNVEYRADVAGRMAEGAVRGGSSVAAGGAKAAVGIAKTKLLAIIAVALVAIAAMIYFLFIKSGTPEDTVAKLETALNDMDQDAVLECFDSQMNDLYSGMLSLGGELTGVDLAGFSDLASGLGGVMVGSGMAPEFNIEVMDVSYTGEDTCSVTVQIYTVYEGESDSEETILPMKKEGREWKISMAAAGDMLY